jgi:trigger factor
LKTSVEKLQGIRVRLTVELTAQEVDRAIANAYSEAASHVRVPGFRAGKAPRQVIDTYVGQDAVLAQALEGLVESQYPLALDAERLRPIERPDVGTLEGLVPGQPYSFTAEMDIRPELTLSSAEGLSIMVPSASASDREVEAQIDHLRDRFATLEPVEDRGVSADDFALISFVGTVDGEPYEGNVVDKFLYEMGAGQMPAEFDGAMLGAKPGDTVRAEFPVPDTSSSPEFVGRKAEFDITVHEVKAKRLPEADDEFAGNVGGFDTIADLRGDIRAKLDENKQVAYVKTVEREARAALVKRLVGDVPKSMIEGRTDDLAHDFFETLKERGYSFEDYMTATGMDAEQMRGDLAEEAEMRVRDDLALEALARAVGMEIADAEVDDEIERLAEAQKTGAAKLRERLIENGAVPLIREDLTHRKAVRWLMENVEVVDGDPEALDLMGGKKKPEAKKAAKPKKAAVKKAAVKKDVSGDAE